MHTQNIDRLVIRQTNKTSTNAWVEFGHQHFPCRIGRSGVATTHREGNGATPRGIFDISYILYRPDRVKKIKTALKMFPIKPNDSWNDDPRSRSYNKPLGHLIEGSDEALWRTDSLYDLIFVITQNTAPNIRGLGSAIFLHVSQENRAFTEGCIAISTQNINRILCRCMAKTQLHIM